MSKRQIRIAGQCAAAPRSTHGTGRRAFRADNEGVGDDIIAAPTGAGQEDEAGVVTSETEGVDERRADPARAGAAGDDVQLDLRILLPHVDRRWNNLVSQSQDRCQGVEGTGGAEEVAGHGLGGGDDGVQADGVTDSFGLSEVTVRRGGGVGVDDVDVVGTEVGVGECPADGAGLAIGVSGRQVVRVGGDTRAGQDGVRRGGAGGREIDVLQYDHGRPLSDHEPVPGGVERPGGPAGSSLRVECAVA